MPELPEVETVRRGISPAMEGAIFEKVQVNRPDLRWPLPERMKERLEGARVQGLRRRSKYILIDLDRGETLLIHLGMSGRILVSGDPMGRFVQEHPAAEKHDHVVFDMSSGARVIYNDPRRFGAMDLIPTTQLETHKLLSVLGPEPLGNAFNEDVLYAKSSAKNSPIKSVLLDQSVVAGLGNIYVCEALFRAGIDPRRKANRVSKERIEKLTGHIRDVLSEAIEAGGSSLKDYRQADGELGYFQHNFDVYGREGGPCRNGGCKGLVQRVVQSGRSSYFCPSCQR